MKATKIIVDNRIFLIGLDDLFRKKQSRFEIKTLLPIVEDVQKDLHIKIRNFPIEGYYNETEELRKYFTLMRNLQQEEKDREKEITNNEAFHKLLSYTGSSLFGTSIRNNLLPVGKDPLAKALKILYPDWTIKSIVDRAYKYALKSDDYSLAGMASLIKDEVAITALRESTVLYSEMMVGAAWFPEPPKIVYEWVIDKELQKRANRFINEFNSLTGLKLPNALPKNAEVFYHAYENINILYRCVRIGANEEGKKFYHWAIDKQGDNYFVKDFWDTKVWTTEMFRKSKHPSSR